MDWRCVIGARVNTRALKVKVVVLRVRKTEAGLQYWASKVLVFNFHITYLTLNT
jgi:hypothetical protein